MPQTAAGDPTAQPRPKPGPTAGSGVLVELYTSQGCSSCPPADELIAELGADGGANIIPLAFHVDYWDSIGWKDPFSSPRWTARQQAYGRALSSGRIYTPQVVVQGRAHAVGSSRADLHRLASAVPLGDHAIALEVCFASSDGTTLSVVVHGEAEPKAPQMDVWVALTQSGLQTSVTDGENRGRKLRNDFVVRELTRAMTLSSPRNALSETLAMTLPHDAMLDDVDVVAFAQDANTMAVYGARRARAPDPDCR